MQIEKGETRVALHPLVENSGKHFHEGNKAVIVEHCGQHLRAAVMLDSGVTIRRLRVGEADYMTEISTGVEKAKRQMRAAGRRLGIAKNAKQFLKARKS